MVARSFKSQNSTIPSRTELHFLSHDLSQNILESIKIPGIEDSLNEETDLIDIQKMSLPGRNQAFMYGAIKAGNKLMTFELQVQYNTTFVAFKEGASTTLDDCTGACLSQLEVLKHKGKPKVLTFNSNEQVIKLHAFDLA